MRGGGGHGCRRRTGAMWRHWPKCWTRHGGDWQRRRWPRREAPVLIDRRSRIRHASDGTRVGRLRTAEPTTSLSKGAIMTDRSDLHLSEAETLAQSLNSDVLLLNSSIYPTINYYVGGMCKNRNRRPNLLLILVTNGGDADAAYRLAVLLQNQYDKIWCFVTGICKSAGTLVAIGAHELVVSDQGELGPLDVQLYKEDEIGERRSGLTVLSALDTLHQQAFKAFEHFMLEIKFRSGGSITTRTATQLAATLTGKLMEPIYGHIDAMHVGEAGRSLSIAKKYGELLNLKSGNLQAGTLDKLTNEYPVHSFVIDRKQAEGLFKRVRPPLEEEKTLSERLDMLGGFATFPVSQSGNLIAFLNSEFVPPDAEVRDEARREVLDRGGCPEDPRADAGEAEEHASGRPPGGSAKDRKRDAAAD